MRFDVEPLTGFSRYGVLLRGVACLTIVLTLLPACALATATSTEQPAPSSGSVESAAGAEERRPETSGDAPAAARDERRRAGGDGEGGGERAPKIAKTRKDITHSRMSETSLSRFHRERFWVSTGN